VLIKKLGLLYYFIEKIVSCTCGLYNLKCLVKYFIAMTLDVLCMQMLYLKNTNLKMPNEQIFIRITTLSTNHYMQLKNLLFYHKNYNKS